MDSNEGPASNNTTPDNGFVLPEAEARVHAIEASTTLMRKLFELKHPKFRKSSHSQCDVTAAAIQRGLELCRTSHNKMGLAKHLRSHMTNDAAYMTKQYHSASNGELHMIGEEHAGELSPSLLWSKYVLPNMPVIIKEALTEWSPVRNWDDHYLLSMHGDSRIPVRKLPHREHKHGNLFGKPDTVRNYETRDLTLREYIESMQISPPPYYAARLKLRTHLPALLPEAMQTPGAYRSCFADALSHNPLCYFGAGKQTTPLHFDGAENLLCMVSGSKSVQLFHPADTPLMYPCGDRNSSAVYSLVDPLLPDPAKFPMYPKDSAMCGKVEKGDMLYLPMGWWHVITGGAARNLSLNYWFKAHEDKFDGEGMAEFLFDVD